MQQAAAVVRGLLVIEVHGYATFGNGVRSVMVTAMNGAIVTTLWVPQDAVTVVPS